MLYALFMYVILWIQEHVRIVIVQKPVATQRAPLLKRGPLFQGAHPLRPWLDRR